MFVHFVELGSNFAVQIVNLVASWKVLIDVPLRVLEVHEVGPCLNRSLRIDEALVDVRAQAVVLLHFDLE
jgi:hypothetical protein